MRRVRVLHSADNRLQSVIEKSSARISKGTITRMTAAGCRCSAIGIIANADATAGVAAAAATAAATAGPSGVFIIISHAVHIILPHKNC